MKKQSQVLSLKRSSQFGTLNLAGTNAVMLQTIEMQNRIPVESCDQDIEQENLVNFYSDYDTVSYLNLLSVPLKTFFFMVWLKN